MFSVPCNRVARSCSCTLQFDCNVGCWDLDDEAIASCKTYDTIQKDLKAIVGAVNLSCTWQGICRRFQSLLEEDEKHCGVWERIHTVRICHIITCQVKLRCHRGAQSQASNCQYRATGSKYKAPIHEMDPQAINSPDPYP